MTKPHVLQIGSYPEWDEVPNASPFAPGDTVRHPKFGKGLVIAVEGVGTDLKVTVSFPHFGKKALNAAMARLEKVTGTKA